jgi:signal transduction histidine kinase/CheY-like chemotaxis protein
MGLSTRILLRICLPAAVLVLGLGITHHYATREQHIAAAQARLQQSAITVSEMIEYRCDEIAQELTEILADDDAARMDLRPGTEVSPGGEAARRALADELRLVLEHDARLLRIDVYRESGAGLVGLGSDGAPDVPAPVGEERWFEPTLAGARHQSWDESRADGSVARISVSLATRNDGRKLVGVALVDFEQIALPAIHSATQGLGPVQVQIECRSGRVQYGAAPVGTAEQFLRAQAPVRVFEGRVHIGQDRRQVLAGLLTFERDAFIVSLLLIACVATLLWTGMRALVLSPLRGMLAVIAAFESGQPIPAPARKGRPSGELALLDDTLRKAFDASVENRMRLQDLNNSLEARVRDRTKELEHNASALRLARDEARKATDAKSSFVANVSHEVRTPLNAIIGMTSMLADTRLDREQTECVETVRQAGENLLSLINHILDFSKMEAGRLELEQIDFDLEETLAGISSLLGPSAKQKGFGLDCSVEETCPTQLRGDPTRLRQVLVNLVGNAIKFTQTGSVRLLASLEPDGELWSAGGASAASAGSVSLPPDDHRVALRIEVTDTGIGIPPDAQARLFAPFSQAENSTTRQFGGTGLGLAICKQIVERMGGRIGVRSQAGQGSTFWCVIPFEARRAQELVGAAPSTQRWELSGLRVLVASQQPASRRLLEQTLAACGTRTDTASTPAAALQLAQAAFAAGQPYHAALLDENLPDESAAGLARSFRTDPALARTPLLLMTRDDDQNAAREAGFQLALAKPLNTVHLVDAVCGVISGAGNQRPERTRSATPPAAPAAPATPAAASAPASPPAALPALPERAEQQPGDGTAGRGRGRLLLAEDNQVNQRVATRVLERLGFRVDVVADGAAAVAAVAGGAYDAVLMDLQMPVMDGYEAVRRIRRSEAGVTRLPIIALTAHAMAGDKERALQDGLDDYVCKPVRPADLAAVLDRWLGGTAAQPAVPAVPGAGERPPADA